MREEQPERLQAGRPLPEAVGEGRLVADDEEGGHCDRVSRAGGIGEFRFGIRLELNELKFWS
jgi:hypothetical protein